MKQRFSTRTRLVSALLTLAMVFTFLPFSAFAATDIYGPVYISNLIFPDETFLNYVKRFDKDHNGTLYPAERYAVTEIDVNYKNITSLKGIEFFPNLKKLDCSNNQLTELDVSKNTELVTLDCSGNELTSLDVHENTALEYLSCSKNQLTELNVRQNAALQSLYCYNNQLTKLDVSQNPALVKLSCMVNPLTSLNVSQNPALKELYCYGNRLTKLDASKSTELVTLDCSSNQLTSLNVSQNPALKKLSCYGNQLTKLDVSKNTALEFLSCDDNKLTSLDVRQDAALKELYCYENQLTELDVSQNTKLKLLQCYSNQLTSLDVSKNTGLKRLKCYSNQLTSLDVSKNMALEELLCNQNQLSSLDVSQTAVTSLDASNNMIDINIEETSRTFDLSTLPGKFDVTKARNWKGGTVSGKTLRVNAGVNQVTYIYDCGKGFDRYFTLNVKVVPDGTIFINASNFPDAVFRAYVKEKFDTDNNNSLSESERNAVTEIDVRSRNISNLYGIQFFPNLKSLYCGNNKLTSLDVSKNLALQELSCSYNPLTSLDVRQNTKLTGLWCDSNQLVELDVSRNPALQTLSCYQNQLTSLNVSKNAELEVLWCYENQLTSLDVSQNPALEYLGCYENQLTSLNVSQNTALEYLDCHQNKLASLDVSQTAVRTLKASGNQIDINVETTPRTFDLSILPGFDVTKVSGWNGGTVNGNILTVNAGTNQVTYTYDCGKGRNIDFTLNVKVVPDGTVTPPSGGDTPGGTTPGGSTPGGSTPGGTTPGGSTPGGTTPGGSTGGGDGGGAVVIVAAAGAVVAGVVGYGVYNYVSGQKLQALLPEGVAAPENRAQTALLLWNTAGRPEPADAPAFADVADPDTAKAAQWCVEQGLMKRRLNGKFAPGSSIPAYQVLNAYRKLAG